MRAYQLFPAEDAARVEMLSDWKLIQSATKEPQLIRDSINLRATRILVGGSTSQKIRDVTFIDYTRSLVVISASLREQLVEATKLNAQWVPIGIDDKAYWLINIVDVINAIDPDKSVIEYLEFGDNRVKADELVLREDAIGDRWLFRDRINQSKALFCTDVFYAWFNENCFTGIDFLAAYDTDIEPFKLSPGSKDRQARPDVYGPGGLFPQYAHHWENNS